MPDSLRIIVDEDGFPRELLNEADLARAVGRGSLRAETKVTIYRDEELPRVCKAADIVELRGLFHHPDPLTSPLPISAGDDGLRQSISMEQAFSDGSPGLENGEDDQSLLLELRDSDRLSRPKVSALEQSTASANVARKDGPSPSPIAWALRPYRHYIDFSGRAPRREVWFYFLFVSTGILLSAIISPTALACFVLASALPSWAVSVRRLHDINISGWFVLVGFVPYLGALALLLFSVLPGTKGSNTYGPEVR